MDLDSAAASDEWSEQVFSQLLADVFEKKGPKLAISEWGSWLTATRYWDSRFHRRSFLFTLLGLEKGLFKAKTLARASQVKDFTAKLDECGAGRGKQVKEKTEQQLRNAGKNTLHCAVRLYVEGHPKHVLHHSASAS